MKTNAVPLTYQDHLNVVTRQPQNNAWDYGLYLKESQMMHSFTEMSSTAIFLLDYASKTYPLLGRNIKQIMGHSREAFLEGGLDFMLHNYLDFEILNKNMFPDQVKMIEQHGSQDILQLRFSKSYRFKSENGINRTILQRHSIIGAKDNTYPIAIFGFAWDITHLTEKGKVVHQIEKYDEEKKEWNSVLSREYYPDIDQNQLLSKREIEILKWSVEGMGSKQIADKLFIAFNTVNTHRRNMLRKTNCQNSMELLRYAIVNKLL